MLNKNMGGWILFISLLIAFLLTALPLPHWANDWRPAWVAMVLIYWCMALPERIGIGIAWCLGLLLDVQQGALLGQNALGLALIAYFVIQIHKQFRLFPLVQQSCLVGFIIIFYLLISSWVTGIMGIPPPDMDLLDACDKQYGFMALVVYYPQGHTPSIPGELIAILIKLWA